MIASVLAHITDDAPVNAGAASLARQVSTRIPLPRREGDGEVMKLTHTVTHLRAREVGSPNAILGIVLGSQTAGCCHALELGLIFKAN